MLSNYNNDKPLATQELSKHAKTHIRVLRIFFLHAPAPHRAACPFPFVPTAPRQRTMQTANICRNMEPLSTLPCSAHRCPALHSTREHQNRHQPSHALPFICIGNQLPLRHSLPTPPQHAARGHGRTHAPAATQLARTKLTAAQHNPTWPPSGRPPCGDATWRPAPLQLQWLLHSRGARQPAAGNKRPLSHRQQLLAGPWHSAVGSSHQVPRCTLHRGSRPRTSQLLVSGFTAGADRTGDGTMPGG
jgi:hypothetical protein